MKTNFDNNIPIYVQIVNYLKTYIIRGVFKSGERLPSVRDLAALFKVNPNTMQKALGELENIKLIYTERTNGKYVTEDKKILLVGNEKLMAENGIKYHACHMEGTVVHIANGGEYAGHIVISDVLKPESVAAIKKLKSLGIKTVMLTGDKEAAAANIAALTKIDEYYSELMPADKVTKTEEIMSKHNGKTVFTGDGINDAPVLMRADVGIAMGGLGSDAAIEAADIVIMDDNISKVSSCVKLSRETGKIAMQNIVFSIFIKILVLILSIIRIPGVMWLAAISDVGVMVIAVCNAMRALKIKI